MKRLQIDGVARPIVDSAGKQLADDEAALVDFWRWFGDSRLVDADGRPLVLYHGTRRKFDSFIPMHPRGAPGNPKGVYFDSDWQVAGEFAMDVDGAIDEQSRIIPAYVRLIDGEHGLIRPRLERGKQHIEVVVFSPELIRLADYARQLDPEKSPGHVREAHSERHGC